MSSNLFEGYNHVKYLFEGKTYVILTFLACTCNSISLLICATIAKKKNLPYIYNHTQKKKKVGVAGLWRGKVPKTKLCLFNSAAHF